MLPPVPYKGDETYIFVSYAHRDSQRVWPVIARLQEDGYRVWYDEGIDPGTEWDENIASHVTECGFFLAFLSENYMASDNCKDELNFSRDQGKPQLLIYLEQVQLPKGMAMRMGRTPSAVYDRAAEGTFYDALYQTSGFENFHKDHAVRRARPGKGAATTFHRRKKRILGPVLLTLGLMLLLGGGLYWVLSGAWRQTVPPQQTVPTQTLPPETTQPPLEKITNVVMLENEQLKITGLDLELDQENLILHLAVENKSTETVDLHISYCYINGVGLEMFWGMIAYYEETAITQLTWERQALEEADIDLENITAIVLEENGNLDLEDLAYYPYGQENAVYQSFVPKETDQLILDMPEYQVYFRDSYYETDIGDGYKSWHETLVFVNRTDRPLLISMEHTDINGYGNYVDAAAIVQPGTYAVEDGSIGEQRWLFTGFDRVLCHSGYVEIPETDPETGERTDRLDPFAIYPEGEAAAAALGPRELTEEQILLENDTVRAGYMGTVCTNMGNLYHVLYVENLLNAELNVNYSICDRDPMTDEAYQSIPGIQLTLLPREYQAVAISQEDLEQIGAPERLWLTLDGVEIQHYDGSDDHIYRFQTCVSFLREME